MSLLNTSMKVALLIVISASLAACKVELTNAEDDDQEDKSVPVLVRSMSAEDETIDHDELYDFELKGDHNSLLLKGSLRRIVIEGSYNEIIVAEDTYIERLVIKGDRNILSMESNDVVIDEVVIDGDNNFLTFNQCQQLTDLGQDNQVALLDDSKCEVFVESQ
jgi:hypothetical protein